MHNSSLIHTHFSRDDLGGGDITDVRQSNEISEGGHPIRTYKTLLSFKRLNECVHTAGIFGVMMYLWLWRMRWREDWDLWSCHSPYRLWPPLHSTRHQRQLLKQTRGVFTWLNRQYGKYYNPSATTELNISLMSKFTKWPAIVGICKILKNKL